MGQSLILPKGELQAVRVAVHAVQMEKTPKKKKKDSEQKEAPPALTAANFSPRDLDLDIELDETEDPLNASARLHQTPAPSREQSMHQIAAPSDPASPELPQLQEGKRAAPSNNTDELPAPELGTEEDIDTSPHETLVEFIESVAQNPGVSPVSVPCILCRHVRHAAWTHGGGLADAGAGPGRGRGAR